MKNKLKNALKTMNLIYQDVADKIEVLTLANVKALANGSKKITPEIALLIEKEIGISAAWLILNKGEMFDKQGGALSQAMENDTTSRITVPYYANIKASAGNGYINDDDSEVDIISLPKVIMDKPNINANKIDAIKVHGDSMYPTVNDGDIIFVCKNIQDVIDNKIYILKIDDEIFIKRLFKRKDRYIIKSDNTLFPQDEIAMDEVTIIGRLIYNMTEL